MTGSDSRGLPAPTPLWERRLIRAAQRGDRAAQTRLLGLYEPMVQTIARGLYLRGGEHEDLAQHARLGVAHAVGDWDPERHVPFKSFARLCARRQAVMASKAARASKHQPLNAALALEAPAGLACDRETGVVFGGSLLELLPGGRPDDDPVRKMLGRERLTDIRARVATLTALEREALALSANDRSHREIAGTLGVGQRAVNNALQRARGKLVDRAA